MLSNESNLIANSYYLSIITIIILISLFVSLFYDSNNDFITLDGEKNSTNIIAIIELNGLIIETSSEISNLTNPFIISPESTKKNLEKMKKLWKQKKTLNQRSSTQRVLETAPVFQILCIYLSTTYLNLAIT